MMDSAFPEMHYIWRSLNEGRSRECPHGSMARSMLDSHSVERRRQYCLRCNQLMFEYFRSPDGHFGLVGTQESAFDDSTPGERELSCPACRARYRLLGRLNALGQPVERK
jgi:hypothetical protein